MKKGIIKKILIDHGIIVSEEKEYIYLFEYTNEQLNINDVVTFEIEKDLIAIDIKKVHN